MTERELSFIIHVHIRIIIPYDQKRQKEKERECHLAISGLESLSIQKTLLFNYFTLQHALRRVRRLSLISKKCRHVPFCLIASLCNFWKSFLSAKNWVKYLETTVSDIMIRFRIKDLILDWNVTKDWSP